MSARNHDGGFPAALVALAVALLLASGCAGRAGGPVTGAPPPPPPATAPAPPPGPAGCPLCADPGSPAVGSAYLAALDNARYPAPSKISRDLRPLLPSTAGLVWDDDGRILMVTWTRAKHFDDPEKYRRGESFPLYGDTWLTAAPVVRDFCRALGVDGAMLDLRLEQRLGMPPGGGHDAFLEIWVDPADVFRPCPDPEISDHECLVEVPVVDRGEQRPWDCSLKRQVSGRYVTVHPGHLRWMCDNWEESYGNDDPLDNYPWTALGYTYDWGNPDDPVGPSEYVAVGGSEVVFESLTPTAVYCSK